MWQIIGCKKACIGINNIKNTFQSATLGNGKYETWQIFSVTYVQLFTVYALTHIGPLYLSEYYIVIESAVTSILDIDFLSSASSYLT